MVRYCVKRFEKLGQVEELFLNRHENDDYVYVAFALMDRSMQLLNVCSIHGIFYLISHYDGYWNKSVYFTLGHTWAF